MQIFAHLTPTIPKLYEKGNKCKYLNSCFDSWSVTTFTHSIYCLDQLFRQLEEAVETEDTQLF